MIEKYKNIDENFDIEVELDIDEDTQTYPWLYSLFIEAEVDESVKLDIINTVEQTSFVQYVGMRFIDGWSEFYFYSLNSKNIQTKVQAYLQENKYKFEGGVVKDSKWDFYRGNLQPTETEFLMIESQKIVQQLVEEGDDIAKEREVEHYVMFDTKTQMQRFIQNAENEGYTFKDEISTQENEYGVAVIKTHNLSYEALFENIELLRGLASQEQGFYELWSTTLAEQE